MKERLHYERDRRPRSMYSGPKISLHSFENAAAAPLPFAVCLTAIFAKICGKTLNPGQTLFGSTVVCPCPHLQMSLESCVPFSLDIHSFTDDDDVLFSAPDTERIYRRHVKLPLLLELRSPPRSFFSNVVSASSVSELQH